MQHLSVVRRSTEPNIIIAKLNSRHKEVAEFSLSLLDISDRIKKIAPSQLILPPTIDKKAVVVWKKLFKDPAFLKTLVGLPTTDQWLIALKTFVTKCHQYNVLPFVVPATTNSASNSEIYKYLAQARKKLVDFLDTIKLFEHFTFYKIKRQFVRSDTDLVVSISCTMRKLDVQKLAAFLCSKAIGFVRHGNMVYKYNVDHTSEIIVDLNKLTLRYSLRVNMPSDKVTMTKPMTEKQFENFIKKDIWFPIVREIKFSTLPVNSI